MKTLIEAHKLKALRDKAIDFRIAELEYAILEANKRGKTNIGITFDNKNDEYIMMKNYLESKGYEVNSVEYENKICYNIIWD